MTTLLQQAFDAAAKLSAAEQDLIAARVLAELAVEDDFDQAIAANDATCSPGLRHRLTGSLRAADTWSARPGRRQSKWLSGTCLMTELLSDTVR